MSLVPIEVALKSDPSVTGIVGTLLATVGAEGQPVLSYGVYWDDPALRVVGYDFRSPAELVWGEMLLGGASAESEEDEEEDEEDEEDEASSQ